MTQYHTFTYATPLAFIEEDEGYVLKHVTDEDYWQQQLSLDSEVNISLWIEDNAIPNFTPLIVPVFDEDYWQHKLSWQYSLLIQ